MSDATTQVEVCTAASLGFVIAAKEGASQEMVDRASSLMKSLDDYLSGFAAPTGKCVKCGQPNEGLFGSLMAGFEWDICWGECRCGCGWPGRAYHNPKDDKGEPIFETTIQRVLQYHPDYVSTRGDD